MSVSILTVMRSVRNFFHDGYREGLFTIVGNVISPVPDAPYIAISGSRQHNGVFACSPDGALSGFPEGKHDEEFSGKVWMLYPPDDFLQLCEQINQYDQKNPIGAMHSESFGDYSYTRGTDDQGGIPTWQEAYSGQLREYRRMFTEVDV